MKTKTIVSLAVAVIITLSFTLISVHNADQSAEKEAVKSSVVKTNSEPAGGFGSEDKL